MSAIPEPKKSVSGGIQFVTDDPAFALMVVKALAPLDGQGVIAPNAKGQNAAVLLEQSLLQEGKLFPEVPVSRQLMTAAGQAHAQGISTNLVHVAGRPVEVADGRVVSGVDGKGQKQPQLGLDGFALA